MTQTVLDTPEPSINASGHPRPNKERANTAIIIMAVLFFVSILSTIAVFLQYQWVERVAYGDYSDDANMFVTRIVWVAIAELLVRIVFIVFFIMWFRRAYYNLNQYGIHTHHTDGWASGAWFVPFLNLVRPFQIMQENWEGYSNLDPKKEETGTPGNGILWLWWLMYLAGNILTNIGSRMDGSLDSMVTGHQLMVFAGFLELLALGALFYIVRTISQKEQRVYQASVGAVV